MPLPCPSPPGTPVPELPRPYASGAEEPLPYAPAWGVPPVGAPAPCPPRGAAPRPWPSSPARGPPDADDPAPRAPPWVSPPAGDCRGRPAVGPVPWLSMRGAPPWPGTCGGSPVPYADVPYAWCVRADAPAPPARVPRAVASGAEPDGAAGRAWSPVPLGASAPSAARAWATAPPSPPPGADARNPDSRTCPSPSGVVASRTCAAGGTGTSRRADSPIRSSAPGAKRTGRSPTRAPSRVVPLVEPRSATETRPSGATVTAQCMRETSGSSSATSASAERPSRIWPPCRRWTPPASGPATTCSWTGTSAGSACGSGSPGAPRQSTAPSTSGGSPRVLRWASRRCAPEYSTTWPEPVPSPGSVAASAEATAARAVPAGAVTSTSHRAARVPAGAPEAAGAAGARGPSGSTTVSRICIAVSGPFARAPARRDGSRHHGPPPRTSPTVTRARRPVLHASSHLPLTTRPPPAAK